MADIIEKYASHPAIRVTTLDTARRLEIEKGKTLLLEVTVPSTMLEWYVTVKNRQTSEELCSTWYDYYATEGETQGELAQDMSEDIADFLDKILQSDIRVIEVNNRSGRRCKMQYNTSVQWQDLFEQTKRVARNSNDFKREIFE